MLEYCGFGHRVNAHQVLSSAVSCRGFEMQLAELPAHRGPADGSMAWFHEPEITVVNGLFSFVFDCFLKSVTL